MLKKKKKKSGLIAIISAAVSLIFLFISRIPMVPLKAYPQIVYFGTINVVFAVIAAVTALIALVFGCIFLDQKSSGFFRFIGLILGIITLVLSLPSAAYISYGAEISKYANGEESIFSNASDLDKADLDNILRDLQKNSAAE